MNLAFAEDAVFILKFRDKMGRHHVGLLEDVEGLCLDMVNSLHVHSTSGALRCSSSEGSAGGIDGLTEQNAQ